VKLIVMLGIPGAGKGTQAKRLSANMSLPHVSSGDLFRENMQHQTALGHEAERYISRGELVPDDITIRMVRARLSQPDVSEGAILDGFPRTTVQAEALEQIAQELGGGVQSAIHVKLPTERLVERMSGRRVCREAGHVYHMEHKPPAQPGVCDVDGSELYQRDDDKPDTVRRRLRVYESQTEPLIEYYRGHGVLLEIDGDQPIEQVTDQILRGLGVGEVE
jgi:adenylate kinase